MYIVEKLFSAFDASRFTACPADNRGCLLECFCSASSACERSKAAVCVCVCVCDSN